MNNSENYNHFALVPRPPGSIEKAEPSANRVLSGMVTDALALVKKRPRSKFRIVWVDDEPLFLEIFQKLIHDWFKGVELLTFQSGNHAWEELQRESPDILVTDLKRNNDSMDGWAMISFLAEEKVKYPVIVVSGCREFAEDFEDEKYKEESARFRKLLEFARQAIDITVLTKPFDVEELRKLLESKLRISREFDLKWRLGARTAALIVKLTNQFVSHIEISCGEEVANAKSIMGVMMVGGADAGRGSRINVSATGPDAVVAMDAVTELFICGSRVDHCINTDCSSKPCLIRYSKDQITYSCNKVHTWTVPRTDKT